MKKFLKPFILIFLALCMIFPLTACKDKSGGDGKVTYTVTITETPDQNFLMLAKIKLTDLSGQVDKTEPVDIVENVAAFKVEEGTYKAVLVPPAGIDLYEMTETVLTPTEKDQTAKIKVKGSEDIADGKVRYIIRVLLPDDSPASGIEVQLCKGNICNRGDKTDGSGYITFDLEPDEYEVHIDASELTASGYGEYVFQNERYKVNAASKTLTVYLEIPQSLRVVVKTAATRDNEGNEINEQLVNGAKVTLCRYFLSNGARIYNAAEGVTDSSGKVDFVIPKVTLRSIYYVNVTYSGYGHAEAPVNGEEAKITIDDEDADPLPDGTQPQKTLSQKEITLIRLGDDKYSRIPLKAGSTQVTYYAARTLDGWFEFDAQNKPGRYSIETTGSVDTFAEHYVGNSAGGLPNNNLSNDIQYNENKSESDKNFYMMFDVDPVSYSPQNTVLAFKISARDVAVSATFNIVITFIREIEVVELPLEYPDAKELKAPIPPPSNSTFTYLELSDEIVYSSADDMYHLGNESGAIIFATVGGNTYFPRPFDVNFVKAYNEAAGFGFAISDGKTYNRDYGKMIKAYSNAGNSDGLHPLTNEYKEFLQGYATNNHNTDLISDDPWPYKVGNSVNPKLFYFACGYYKQND